MQYNNDQLESLVREIVNKSKMEDLKTRTQKLSIKLLDFMEAENVTLGEFVASYTYLILELSQTKILPYDHIIMLLEQIIDGIKSIENGEKNDK